VIRDENPHKLITLGNNRDITKFKHSFLHTPLKVQLALYTRENKLVMHPSSTAMLIITMLLPLKNVTSGMAEEKTDGFERSIQFASSKRNDSTSAPAKATRVFCFFERTSLYGNNRPTPFAAFKKQYIAPYGKARRLNGGNEICAGSFKLKIKSKTKTNNISGTKNKLNLSKK
jgi:hypothetical protein